MSAPGSEDREWRVAWDRRVRERCGRSAVAVRTLPAPLARQFFSQPYKKTAPALFDHLRSIGPVDEGALAREDQVGTGFGRLELESQESDLDRLSVQGHFCRGDDALFRDDVLVGGFIEDLGAGNGMA